MTQNTSSAVMQQRSEPHDSLDDFPTPPWATRALCAWLGQHHELLNQTVREPAANRGHMVKPLREHFGAVLASDVHDYGAGFDVRDYLFGPTAHLSHTDWTITNPPFRLAEQFIERALELSRVGVAMIVRSAFLEGVGRFERLFGNCWLIWEHACTDTFLDWIGPCRKQLERADDYAHAVVLA